MLSALVLLAVAFPGEPLADQVAVGQRLAVTEPRLKVQDLFRSPEPRSPLGVVWGKDRVAVGLWSNGYTKVPVEYVLWVSPALVSRWLGFLSAREHWTEEQLVDRWNAIAMGVGDRRVFIVQLTAFPKVPTYGVGDYQRTTTEEIENVRFVYTAGDKSVTMQSEQIAQWQSRDRKDLDAFPWWQYLSFGQRLIGEFEPVVAQAPLPLGDYHRAWYLVWVADSEEPSFEVRVLSRRKERVAEFRLSK